MLATIPDAAEPQQVPPTTQHNDDKVSGVIGGCVSCWKRATGFLHLGITNSVIAFSLLAARNPKRCIGLVCLLSIALITTGVYTNMEVSTDDEQVYAPVKSLLRDRYKWVDETYPVFWRPLMMIVHANGDNVMTYEAMRRLMEATNQVQALDRYETMCAGSDGTNSGCGIPGPTRFWQHNMTLFEKQTQGSDEVVMQTLSQEFLDGVPFPHSLFIGNIQREEITGKEGGNATALITSAQSLFTMIEFPYWPNGESQEFELEMINLLKPMKDDWAAQGEDQPYRLEFYALRTLPDELTRAIESDIPLIPCVFAVMAAFTCMVFCRRDVIQSRALLGIGSVVTILLSIMSGFGLMFIIGLPFTSMTTILPFAIFGIGLDDTFIIVGAYLRTDPAKDPVERIRETMEEVGVSISLTTITTTVAFVMGALTSSIPIIQWLCLYAFPTICIDFLYQISFFVAILVLDERRIAANRRGCCVCFRVSKRGKADTDGLDEDVPQVAVPIKAPVVDRFMAWYCEHLFHPIIKVFVMIAFAALLSVCIYSTTLLEQEFKPAEFLPDGSYAFAFIDSLNMYTNRKMGIFAFFRDIDQSDPQVQQQMIDYLHDLGELPQVNAKGTPDLCWVTDFQKILNGDDPALEAYSSLLGENSTLTFTEKLDFLLSFPEINQAYGNSIVRNEDGEIVASNCWVAVNYLDMDVVQEQITFLADQQKVTAAQPINQGDERYKFFAFDIVYFIWEFYSVVVKELTFTTVSGIVAVTVIAFILIPHWSAALFVFPLMCMLYIDLLGILQFAGLSVNPLTYICLVISVGLLVDFIMHMILRYYESRMPTREEKVKDTLRTMGSSILVGGLSTCLGVSLLAFSSGGLIQTVFIMFIAMVSVGLAHGLILLPVILSYVGPTVCIKPDHCEGDNQWETPDDDDDDDDEKNTELSPEDGAMSKSNVADRPEPIDWLALCTPATTEDESDTSTPGFVTEVEEPASSMPGTPKEAPPQDVLEANGTPESPPKAANEDDCGEDEDETRIVATSTEDVMITTCCDASFGTQYGVKLARAAAASR
ncbi:Pick C1-like protein 1 [Seminavis robusta]|uniref:Pick C1-like protein 1 n=1 Tax=Seminavis robusta TaxID=568900 RepID=A0A9N8DTK2_9STRA|nr:Pick C1-like protein 1 [Seminavis robusta]|eukprot:Sro267_g103430.1 Pick C1-like protein 1 (1052) ;mRNA; f:47146-50550